ncbi:dihydrodipicolinate synthase family protein [Paenibacillus cymbidii]|uniref:dihydrodipicolinate synthase family protein n=1 Tax=Paenibacillus cymbidii TaxID=1639034 RepID=UPI001A9A92B4|nr:dihydrodipicolinate synthase family protein [Paenibacillus cymbidii]
MKRLNAEDIKGTWGTVLLPLGENETIDYARMRTQIETIAAAGVNGIYSNGTAGEFYAQSEAEYETISELVAEVCEARGLPFQLGASHMSPQTSLERIRRAVKLAPGAIQVILSDWYALTDDEAIDCLQRMEDAADGIGLVLYNPPHAKRVLQPETYGKLKAAVPNLIGAKTAGGDSAWYASMREHMRGMSVFVPGHRLATGISQGAHGSYSNVACLSPAGAQRWYERMQTDLAGALEAEERIFGFIRDSIVPYITEQGYSNAAVDKLLAAIGGWSDAGTKLRWPYRSIPLEEAERLRPIAVAQMPELFA